MTEESRVYLDSIRSELDKIMPLHSEEIMRRIEKSPDFAFLLEERQRSMAIFDSKIIMVVSKIMEKELAK